MMQALELEGAEGEPRVRTLRLQVDRLRVPAVGLAEVAPDPLRSSPGEQRVDREWVEAMGVLRVTRRRAERTPPDGGVRRVDLSCRHPRGKQGGHGYEAERRGSNGPQAPAHRRGRAHRGERPEHQSDRPGDGEEVPVEVD